MKEIEKIVNDPNLNQEIDEEFKNMSLKEKISGILSDFGPHERLPNLLVSLGYPPDLLARELDLSEQGLMNYGFTPEKLEELGYNPKDFYKGLGEDSDK